MTKIEKLLRWMAEKPLLTLLGISLALCTSFAAAPAARDYVISTLRVWPAASENGTNSVLFYNKAGTNWVGVEPTNALLTTRISGTNYTAIAVTNFFLTNGGVANAVKIRNGLWVQ